MIVKKSYLLLFTALVIIAGCRDRTQVTVSDIRPRETNSDHLQQALQIIDDLDAADFNQATTTSVFNFSLWSKLHDDDPQWVTPSLINTVPTELASTGLVQAIGGKRFKFVAIFVLMVVVQDVSFIAGRRHRHVS